MIFDLSTRKAELPRPIVTARGEWPSRTSVLLTLKDRSGLAGRGEAAPLPGYSPDDADACLAALSEIARALDPKEPEDDALAWLDRTLAPFDARLAALPAARFALETALLDLAARARGTSIARLVAGDAIAPVPRSALVDLASPTLEDDARALVLRAIGTIKAKIGARPLADDLAALARLRAAIGPDVRLRLDANGALSRGTLDALAPLAPELVEEPVSGEALLALGSCAVRWAADESLQDARIARALLDDPACAAFVLKPALHGLRGAFGLARAAATRGKLTIVTHLFDGPIAVAAACELALIVSALSFGCAGTPEFPGPSEPAPSVRISKLARPELACGLDPHPGLAVVWGSVPIPQLIVPGLIVPHEGAGLGVP